MPSERAHFILDYDQITDVLYVYLEARVPSRAEEDDDGLIWTYRLDNGTPLGVTIVDYNDFWRSRRARLVSRMSEVFHFPATVVDRELHVAE